LTTVGKPQPLPTATWTIYKLAAKRVTIEKAAAECKVPAMK
jgi:hypothetical protein